jgi:hypothetical protein
MCCSCSKTTVSINQQSPIQRLQRIEDPTCNNKEYSDVCQCLILYKKALDQSNKDKETAIELLKTKEVE